MVPPPSRQRMEGDPDSEMLYSLDYWTMDKVPNPRNPDYYLAFCVLNLIHNQNFHERIFVVYIFTFMIIFYNFYKEKILQPSHL
jgi:hypothetical protein